MAKKTKAARRGSPKRRPAASTPSPRSQALPGMEQVRNVRLDRFCESIGEGREKMNVLRNEEKGDLQGALREMHDKRVTAYRHAGVELVRVPGSRRVFIACFGVGEEKLRVRTSKEGASDITETDDESAG